MAETKPKPKLNRKAIEMAKQDPHIRAKNFDEVALGYTEAEAQEEASRCLCCPNPLCRTGCPVEVPIPQFVKCIKDKKYAEGIAIIKSKNMLTNTTANQGTTFSKYFLAPANETNIVAINKATKT